MATETFLFDGHTVYFRLPQTRTETTPAVFLLTGGDPSQLMEQAAASLKKLSPGAEPLFICMPPDYWNLDFSPWPAPALNETDDPFEGGADDYLHFLETRLLPEIRRRFHAGKPFSRSLLAGYSLGGLTTLYGLFHSGRFDGYGCLSGSLWYPGWVDFAASHPPVNPQARVFLSLGKKEAKTRRPVMSGVGQATEQTFSILQKEGVDVRFDWNNGGHFFEIPERFARALAWLLKEDAI